MENEQKPNIPQDEGKKVINFYLLFELGLEFALLIALPLLAFIYAGKWLDNRFHTKFIVVIGILLALTVSSFGIYKRIIEAKKLIK